MASKENTPDVPHFHQMYNALIQALRELGGSGRNDEILDRVTKILKIPEEVAAIPQSEYQTKLAYNLAWSKTNLKNYGLLQRSGRGVWAIKPEKLDVERVNPAEVQRFNQALFQKTATGSVGVNEDAGSQVAPQDPDSPDIPWKQILHRVLTTVLSPAAFERLIMLFLRESGFVNAEVAGRSGDGGIDGKGIARIHGVLSFRVVFQCKRYQGSVTSSQVRDFRGAMAGRAEKGLLITTGRFTRDAVREATRDGAPPIDLIDGDQLADLLVELQLGVKTETVERIVVDEAWLGAV